MNYLDKTIADMKEKIMLTYQYVKNAKTAEEVSKRMAKLEGYLKEKLLQSFKNGIEVGGKKRGSGRQNKK